MVVSVDISGVLEERLRRLVEVGLYASVAEAVRDGVRRLLKELDLKKLSLDLYERKNVTLRYACYFAGSNCDEFIDYLIINNIYPLLGEIKDEYEETAARISVAEGLVLDPSSIYVLYRSGSGRVLTFFVEMGKNLFVSEGTSDYLRIMEAYALHRGIMRELPKIDVIGYCSGRRIKVKGIVLTEEEEDSLSTVYGCRDMIFVVDDIRLRNYARANGISTVSSISLLEFLNNNNIIDDNILLKLLYSLKSIPVLIPPSIQQE